MAKKILYLFRHAKAAKADPRAGKREGDIARPLDAAAEAQILARKGTLPEGMVFDRAFASSAFRTIDTIMGITGLPRDEIIVLPELYTPEGPDGEVLDALFEALANSTPIDYLEHELNDGSVERFGRTAWETLWAEIETDTGEEDETVGACGHGVFTQMTAVAALGQERSLTPAQRAWRNQLHDLKLDETGMIRLVLEDGVVTDLQILN